jgi:hypothetical protein
MVAAHGDPWFTGEGDRAAKATGAREAYVGEFGMQKERVPVADGAKQQGEGDKASSCRNYCGGEVVVGGCSGEAVVRARQDSKARLERRARSG